MHTILGLIKVTLVAFLWLNLVLSDEGNDPLSKADFNDLLRNRSAVENLVDIEGREKSISEDDLPSSLRNWKAPAYIREHFPVYLSGFDYEDRPIWIAEIGKYNLHAVLSRGSEAERDLEKYIAYVARTMVDSNSWKDANGYTGSFILDFDEMKYTNFGQFNSVAFLIRLGYRYRRILEDRTEYVAIINANYAAEATINTARPIIGRVMEVVEIYGTDKSKWRPQLLRHFPRETLPEWYGGFKNFTPIRVL